LYEIGLYRDPPEIPGEPFDLQLFLCRLVQDRELDPRELGRYTLTELLLYTDSKHDGIPYILWREAHDQMTLNQKIELSRRLNTA